MKEITIGYVTENPSREYADAIRQAKTRKELVTAIRPFRKVADDALACAERLTDQDFADLMRDLPKAKRKQSDKWTDEFNRRFGPIAMPTKLIVASLVANKFGAPWGCAFIRCEEEGWPMLAKTKSK